MSYTPQTWTDNDPTTPLSGARLTHMETGIAGADAAATAAAAAAAAEATARSSAIAAEAAARDTAITTAVNNLLNGAPGALDTLKELADALNDDPSFAATVTTALAGKAPVATTTIDLVDRTNNTTETVPAGTTTNCATAGVTKTAPALDNPVATPPKRFAVKNISTGSITVAYPDQAGSAQSLTMLTGETRTFRQKSTSGWGVESGALALSTLDGRFAPITGSAAYVPYGLTIGRGQACVPVGIRPQGGFDTPDTATTAATYRMFMPLIDPNVTAVLPVFGLWQSSNGIGADYPLGVVPINVSCAVETSDGVLAPFTFGGAHQAKLIPGGTLIPDAPVHFGLQVSANDKFGSAIARTGVWLRVYASLDTVYQTRTDTVGITNASSTVTDATIAATDYGKALGTATGVPANSFVGTVVPGVSFTMVNTSGAAVIATATNASLSLAIQGNIPTNLHPYSNTDQSTASGGADLTVYNSGSVSGGAQSGYFGPVLLLARSRARQPIVGLISDSIGDGYQDDFHSPYFGPFARACLALGLPFVKASKGGESSVAWSTASQRRYRATLLEGCTHVIVELGTNDQALTTGAGAAGVTTMLTRYAAILAFLQQIGAKAYLSTVPPRTSSTDAWATTTNQTPLSGSQITYLASLNQAIRAVPSGWSGVYDLAADCMSATDSGLWTPGATGDGVHPSDTLSRGAMTTRAQTLISTFSL